METDKLTLGEFLIAGISVRTINNGQAGIDIKNLWDRFYKEDIAASVHNKLSSDVYCVYTDYAGDHNDYYTAMLGYKVSSIAVLPHGIAGCVIPASAYKVYESKGDLPHSVLATWKAIWDGGLPRKYAADFDVYTHQSWDNGSVLTYVGV